jgi:magnesium-transporting ATPase (P-type)
MLPYRFNSDTECNQRTVLKMRSGGAFEPVESQSLRVGHVIKVECDNEFPADVVMLQVCCLSFNLIFCYRFQLFFSR